MTYDKKHSDIVSDGGDDDNEFDRKKIAPKNL